MAEMKRFILKVPKEDIYYISWTIDAYEGVAFLQNEREEGVVSIFCSPDYEVETDNIITALASEGMAIERMDANGG